MFWIPCSHFSFPISIPQTWFFFVFLSYSLIKLSWRLHFVTNDKVTHYRKLAESEGLQRRRSLCQEAFLFFQVALGRAPGLYTQCVHGVCEAKIERYLAFKKLGFLERQSTVSSFLFKYLFQTSDNPTWVSRIQTQTRRIALRTVTETPEVYAVFTVGGDDVRMHTYHFFLIIWARQTTLLNTRCGGTYNKERTDYAMDTN